MIELAIFSKHLTLLLGTNSATNKYNIQPGASSAREFKAHYCLITALKDNVISSGIRQNNIQVKKKIT